jgi:phosphopantetheinyl transferase (holo-ACP synthase)
MERFAEYFLNSEELADFKKSKNASRFIGSRFVAKEAVIKAFPGFIAPHEFSIMKVGKKPMVQFASPAREKEFKAFVSITYSTNFAIGYAVVTNS